MELYLTKSCLQSSSFCLRGANVYCAGIENLKRVFLNNHFINSKYNHNYLVSSPSLTERVKHLAAGIVLLIPIINTFAIIFFREMDVATIERMTLEKVKRTLAAIKIQRAFRRFKARPDPSQAQSEEVVKAFRANKISIWFGKACKYLSRKKFIIAKYVSGFIKRQTKIDSMQLAGCLLNLKTACKALKQWKFKISVYYVSLAAMNIFNAICRLFAPPGTMELERANRYALGNSNVELMNLP